MKISSAFILISLAGVVKAAGSNSNSTNSTTTPVPPIDKGAEAVKKWKETHKEVQKVVGKMVKSMLPQILRASEDLDLSVNCSRSMMKFLTGLKQMQYWAFKMVDASGKLPNGIMSGSINSFGDYDICVNTQVPGHFQGQYCIVEVEPPLPERERFVSYDIEIPEFVNVTRQSSITAEFMRKGRYYYHMHFRSSICVPSTCTRPEVQGIASKVMELSGIKFDIGVPHCEIKVDKIVLSDVEIGILALLCTVVFIAVAGTITDVVLKLTSTEETYQKNMNVPVQCLVSFSFYTNLRKLLRTDKNPESIEIFHGMKAITILWVMLSHNYYYQNFQAMSHLLAVREKGKEFFFSLISNGVLTVETFFFISAVLVSYGVTKLNGKKLNVFLYLFRRFWRLTPPLMLVICCAFLLPHLGSGPVWKETIVDGITAKCWKNWWSNLLYFNNFLAFDEMCLNWSWYVSVDTHLYILSLLVLIPLQKNPRLAFVINGLLFLGGIIMTACFHVYYQLTPVAIYVYQHPDDINYFINRGYYRTYLHVSTYSIGLCVGYMLATKKFVKIPLIVNLICWCFSIGAGLYVALGVYDYNQGYLPSQFVSTLFASTNKFIWSLALGYVTLACMSGHGGIATTILSWNGFVPLSRLTYMTYLVHPIIHFTYLGSTRNLIAAEHRTLVHQYCGTVVLSFLLACLLSLLFEAPFMALEKVFLTRRPRDSEEKVEVEAEGIKFQPTFLHNGDSKKEGLNVYTINFKNIKSDT